MGMSELNSLRTFNGLPGKPTPGTLGVPVVGEVRVTVDGSVAAREIEGEIEFCGLQVSRGYLGRPEDTEASFGADGWLRTGDIGYLDQHGALHYVDRKKELLFVSGYNVAPAEIEATLLQHPRITDAAVVGEDLPIAVRSRSRSSSVTSYPTRSNPMSDNIERLQGAAQNRGGRRIAEKRSG